MTPAFELDPERALWKPTRRFFLMGLGAAIVAPSLPAQIPPNWDLAVAVNIYAQGPQFVLTEAHIVAVLEEIRNARPRPIKYLVATDGTIMGWV